MIKKYSLVLIACLCVFVSGFGQTTVAYDFSDSGAQSGFGSSVSIDSNISFESFKNNGTSNPGIFSNQLRLYQNATKGGSIVITPSNGVTITSVVVYASGTTGDAGYTVDGGTATNLNASTTYTMNSISAVSEVEFYQREAGSGNRIYVDSFEVTYTSVPSGPTITTSTSSITTGLDYIEGSGPSSEQSFDVTGSNLTDDIVLSGLSDFRMSTTMGGPYSNANITIPLASANGTTTIYVILNGGLSATTYNETITAASTGATDVDVDLEGTVTPLCTTPSSASNIIFSNITASSMDIDFTGSGADNYLVVRSLNATLTPAAPTNGNTHAVSTSFGGGTVVYNGSGNTFTDNGLSSNTIYYYFVFAYNDTACSGGPAYAASVSNNATTISGPCLSDNFNSGYGNWTNGTGTYNNGTAGNTGNGIGFNTNNDDIITNSSLSNPSSISFIARASGSTSNYTINIQYSTSVSGPWTTATSIVANGSNTGDIITTSNNYNLTLNLVGNYYLRFLQSFRSGGSFYLDDVDVFCGPAGPEIEIQGNATEIVDGDVTPDVNDDTDFGNVAVAGGSTVHTFTIYNTGGADLILNGTSPNYVTVSNTTDFNVSAQPAITTIPDSGTNFTTFQITFDPASTGTKTATVSIANDDADENPYTFVIQGNGTNSNLSTITDNTNYSGTSPEFNSNTEYINFIDGTSTSAGKFIPMKLRILDGPDSDGFDTILTDISFTVEDLSNTSQLAMIKTAILTTIGGTPLATATKIGNELVFSGMNSPFLTAPDDDTNGQIFHLRVSLDETQVIDNTKLVFKVTSATADPSGSSFTATDAGGAETDTGNNNRNRLNVTADRLSFTTQPSDTSVSINMSPSPVVGLTDVYGNTDLDITTGTITMTSTGTPNTQPSATIVNGQAVFNNVNHSAAGGPFTLTANYSGWNVTSNSFIVSNTANGSYRTTGSGNWLSNQSSPAIWEQFNGSAWIASNSPNYNTSNDVYIRNGHTINSGGSWGNSVNMIINNGGTFNVNHSGTAGNLTILDGGNVTINANLSINSNGTIEVQDNGDLTVNFEYGNPVTSLWNGIEIFHPDSNLIFNDFDCADEHLIYNNSSVSTNTFSGYTAAFGNIIVDFGTNLSASDDWILLDSGVSINMAHSDLVFRSTSSGADMRVATTGTVTSGIGGDFIVEDGYDNTRSITFKTSGLMDFTIQGDMELNAATTRIHAGSAGTGTTLNINGDLRITPSAVLNMNPTSASGPYSKLYLKGDVEVAGSGLLTNGNSVNQGEFYFSGTGDGLTDITTQTIDIASTSSNENKDITFYIESGAYVKQINRDFELGTNSALVVNSGGVYNFGFDGLTALNLAISPSQTGSDFSSRSGSTLIITSPDGINTTGYLGNVQTLPSGRTFNQTATFYYVGKDDQVTGNALTVGSSVKNVYVNLEDDTIELRLTNRTGISDGGKLEIQQGIVIGEEAGINDNDFYGPDGQLIMTGGEYRISTITANPLTDYLPQLRKYGSYSLTNGTIHLNGDNAIQILSGTPNYYNLTFSGINTLAQSAPLPPQPYNYKGISIATSIANNVTISEDAIVDVENKTFGGATTNLIMEDNARYITAGSGTKPDATGSYSFGPDTTLEFNNSTGLEEIRLSNPVPAYANIVVSGSNVGTLALGTGPNSYIQFQPSGSFTITETGTFKLANSFGFSGANNTAISNTNNPSIVLEDESTVEYFGANQIITQFSPEYKNVTLSGSDTKTLGHPKDVFVGEDLNINSSTLLVNSNEAITVDEGVKVSGGNFNVEDSGSLIQVNNNDTNSGSISMKRNTTIRQSDYVYWSSPVENFNINTIYGTQTPTGYIYEWNTTITNPMGGEGNWVPLSSSTMQKGIGYIVRGPDDHDDSSATVETATFNTGKPHNGQFTVNVFRGDNPSGFDTDDDDWNLLGNPYPSAIDAHIFLTNTTNAAAIDGFVYLWTHGTIPDTNNSDPFYDNFGSNYNANEYVAYNKMGAGSGPGVFFIGAGQAFMVNMNDGPSAASLPVEFENNMRHKDHDNSLFYRNSNNQNGVRTTNNEEKHRIWLDFVSDVQPTSRILVGFAEGATQERDRLYDAISDNQSFYSLIGEKSFAIQGLGLPFNDDDVIPLGIKINAQGGHYIAIAEIDGMFETEDQIIYLKDNESGFIHNLIEAPYSFNSDIGTFNDRFEIVFRPNVLSIDDYNANTNNLNIIELDGDNVIFKLDSGNVTITDVEIINLLGRTVYKFKGSSNTETFNLSNLSSSAYMARVTLSNNQVITKKAIKK